MKTALKKKRKTKLLFHRQVVSVYVNSVMGRVHNAIYCVRVFLRVTKVRINKKKFERNLRVACRTSFSHTEAHGKNWVILNTVLLLAMFLSLDRFFLRSYLSGMQARKQVQLDRFLLIQPIKTRTRFEVRVKMQVRRSINNINKTRQEQDQTRRQHQNNDKQLLQGNN